MREKIDKAIKYLQAFLPREQSYFVAFSGGKDSQCIYHLCEMAGVPFDAHYAITSVDPPELVKFIRENYPAVAMEASHYEDRSPRHVYTDGRAKPVTMWS